MNMFSKALVATALVAVSATAASACNVNFRQYNQQHRIWNGAYNGNVTFGEFLRLERGQAKVRRLERIFRNSGGGISPWECAVLNNALNWQSVRIYVKKHN
jgi:hypothetical protein